jgi:hypothetical protein
LYSGLFVQLSYLLTLMEFADEVGAPMSYQLSLVPSYLSAVSACRSVLLDAARTDRLPG